MHERLHDLNVLFAAFDLLQIIFSSLNHKVAIIRNSLNAMCGGDDPLAVKDGSSAEVLHHTGVTPL